VPTEARRCAGEKNEQIAFGTKRSGILECSIKPLRQGLEEARSKNLIVRESF